LASKKTKENEGKIKGKLKKNEGKLKGKKNSQLFDKK